MTEFRSTANEPTLTDRTPAPAVKASQRYFELDAVRGLAAVAVVLFHYTVRYFELYAGAQPGLQFTYGALGVQVFFGISGFVILMTLERSRTAGEFLVSRFSRLYPAYWGCLAITIAALSIHPLPGHGVSLHGALVNLTMWQELLRVEHVDGVYWSLQVELIFYTLMLGLYLFGWLRHIPWLLGAWLVLALLAQAAAWALHRSPPYVLERFLLIEYSPYFSIGAAAYLDFRHRRVSRSTWALFALAVGTAVAWKGALGAGVSLGMVALFVALVHRKATFLNTPLLVFLGTVSYPLYLLHQNIGYAIMQTLGAYGVGPGVAMWAAFAVALGLAWLVTQFVERPAMRWIRAHIAATRPVPRVAA